MNEYRALIGRRSFYGDLAPWPPNPSRTVSRDGFKQVVAVLFFLFVAIAFFGGCAPVQERNSSSGTEQTEPARSDTENMASDVADVRQVHKEEHALVKSAANSEERTRNELVDAIDKGKEEITVIALVDPEQWEETKFAVQTLGAEIVWDDRRTAMLALELAPQLVHEVEALPGIEKLSAPGKVKTALEFPKTAGVVDPAESMNVSREAARADRVLADGIDGTGTVIAIVDTGVDPAVVSLQTNPSGTAKIIDWVDFTDDGLVKLDGIVSADASNTIVIDGQRYELPRSAVSRSNRYVFGYWEEMERPLSSRVAGDVNRNGKNNDRFLVIAADRQLAGHYDTVWVDLDGDGVLTESEALGVFRTTGTWAQFGSFGLGFVLVELDPDGTFARFGFDANGHGTFAAEVAAGWRSKGNNDEAFAGMAPGASIMVVKAIPAHGTGTWDAVLRGVRYAAQNGADVINISINGSQDMNDRNGPESEMLRRIAKEYGVLIVMAAGNMGPGLGTVSTPGDADWMLTVGAYHSPAIWQHTLGHTVHKEGVWAYSGRGPRPDGSLAVNLIAPGAVAVETPPWLQANGVPYQVFQGTSAAAPHASGYAALVLDAMRQSGQPHSLQRMIRILAETARLVSGLPSTDQGYGLIDVARAVEAVRARLPDAGEWQARWVPTDDMSGLHPVSGRASAVIEIATTGPARVVVADINHGSSEKHVSVDREVVFVPRSEARFVNVMVEPIRSFGLHSSLLMIRDEATNALLTGLPVTHIEPIELSETNRWRTTLSSRLSRAELQRAFIKVPEGTARLEWRLRATDENATGNMRWYLYRPDGSSAHVSEPLGKDEAYREELLVLHGVQPGVWELVVDAGANVPPEQGFSWSAEIKASGIRYEPVRISLGEDARSASTSLRLEAFGQPARVRYETAGFDVASVRQRASQMQVSANKPGFFRLPTVPEGTKQLHIEFSAAQTHSEDRDEGRFQIFLYREDAVTGELLEVGRSNVAVLPVIDVVDAPAGNYIVWVEGSELPAQTVTGQLLYGMWRGSGLHATAVDQRHETGRPWWVWLQASRLPAGRGIYYGSVLIRNVEDEQLLAVVPVEIRKGLPKLWVQLGDGVWTPGVPHQVVVHVRDGDTLEAVATEATINGRIYPVRDGEVTWSPPAGTKRAILSLVIADPRYDYVEKTWTFHQSDE